MVDPGDLCGGRLKLRAADRRETALAVADVVGNLVNVVEVGAAVGQD